METVTQSATNAKPIVVKSVAWAWGFEDGCQGKGFFDGNDLFIGPKLVDWRKGWKEAQRIQQAKRTH